MWNNLEVEIIDHLTRKQFYSHEVNLNQLLLSMIDIIKQDILNILENDSSDDGY